MTPPLQNVSNNGHGFSQRESWCTAPPARQLWASLATKRFVLVLLEEVNGRGSIILIHIRHSEARKSNRSVEKVPRTLRRAKIEDIYWKRFTSNVTKS
ncbi:hypothetical protein BM1_01507 [Bipolaris maydis]|nr:hypothetical protein BM1_01507 [Bipolaris maydis]